MNYKIVVKINDRREHNFSISSGGTAMETKGKGSGDVDPDINMRKMRRHPRIKLNTFHGDVTDSRRICHGKIADASTAGLKMIDIEADFFTEKIHYTLALSGKEQNHRVIVTPCWIKKKSSGLTADVGLKLVSAPWEWITFVIDQATLKEAGVAMNH